MRRLDIITSVLPAFLFSGALNAWTPLLTASMPVSAVQPAANARRTMYQGSTLDSLPTTSLSTWKGITGVWAMAQIPARITANIASTKP